MKLGVVWWQSVRRLYYYSNPFYQLSIAEKLLDLDQEETVESKRNLYRFFNYVKHVVRLPDWQGLDFRQAVLGGCDAHLDNPLTRYMAGVLPSDRVSSPDVERAIENMKRQFAVVGIAIAPGIAVRTSTDQSGVHAQASTDPVTTRLTTPAGPTAWMSTSLLRRPTEASAPSKE